MKNSGLILGKTRLVTPHVSNLRNDMEVCLAEGKIHPPKNNFIKLILVCSSNLGML